MSAAPRWQAAPPMTLAHGPARDTTGLILCGGRGSRMGGVDKGLLADGDRPLITHVVERLAPQVAALLISANRNLDTYREIAPVVPDPGDLEAYAGPLAGILAGLRVASTPWVAVVPCDTPRLPLDLVRRLAGGLGSSRAAYAVTGAHAHPLACLLASSLRQDLDAALHAGMRRAGEWMHRIGARPVPFDDAAAFANLNTPEDLAAAAKDAPR
jgi:molybdopterin-guanine dinucleotide biosynthesis protein A